MGLIQDDTLECKSCGHDKFREDTQVVFHKRIKERVFEQDREKRLQHLQKIYVYKCSNCGQELDK
jgi:uncharacterized Zn finger protein